ncbi:MAG: autotransporter domain-containing protein, partial [Alphaproteobacteria bacterium]|nr:autotransporter domain-containing protein [Alphaproteobacteria bacterium]
GKKSAVVTGDQKASRFRNFGLLESEGKTFLSEGGAPVLLNKGKIWTSSKILGDYAVGGESGGRFHLINTGIIKGSVKDGIPAIKLSGGGTDILEFRKGSSILGDIVLNDTTNLIFGKGMLSPFRLGFGGSGRLSFDEEELKLFPVPVFYSAYKRVLSVFDPVILTFERDILAFISGNVSSLVASRFSSISPSSDRNLWASSTFSSTELGGGLHIPFQRKGIAAGYDYTPSSWLSYGVLGGYDEGEYATLESEMLASHENSLTGLFLSLHAKAGWKGWSRVFVNTALSGGVLLHHDKRFMTDNQRQDGRSRVDATYKSFWVAPEVTVGANFGTGFLMVTPSLRGRIAYQSVDGYTEKGRGKVKIPAVATFARRSSNVLEGRFQLAITKKLGGMSLVSVYSGLQYSGIMMSGKDLNLSMFGMNRKFRVQDQEGKFSNYTGGLLKFSLGKGAILNASGEVLFRYEKMETPFYRVKLGMDIPF